MKVYMEHSKFKDMNLNAQYAKYQEEGTADDDDVTDGFEWGEESLDNQLESRSSVDDPQGSQGSDEAKYTEYLEETVVPTSKCCDEAVQERDEDESSVKSVPVVRKVIPTPQHKPNSNRFHQHLQREDQGEDVVWDIQCSSLYRPE